MNFEQTTDRLILRILSADDAEKVLQFYKDNAAIFEQFEPLIGNDFYSLEHQKNLLTYEYQEILKLHMRVSGSLKKIIPTVSSARSVSTTFRRISILLLS